MKKNVVIFYMLLTACTGGAAPGDPRWGHIKTPSEGPPQSIGAYNAGCLVGAYPLPPEGTGYQIMRMSRNRYYGHPELISFINKMGYFAAREGFTLAVGDLTQPRGGPMSSGHTSHQTGLDADIWYWHSPQISGAAQRERISPSSLVTPDGRLKSWQPYYSRLLQYAAEQPEVERIFVNPSIKEKLCQTTTDKAWLHKIRPWHRHDDHFHVRLRCPADDGQCTNQVAIEEGDGCNDLAWWLREKQQKTSEDKPEITLPSRPVPLPQACESLLPREAL